MAGEVAFVGMASNRDIRHACRRRTRRRGDDRVVVRLTGCLDPGPSRNQRDRHNPTKRTTNEEKKTMMLRSVRSTDQPDAGRMKNEKTKRAIDATSSNPARAGEPDSAYR